MVNNEAVRRDFDLSRNESLRTLETTAGSIAGAGDNAPGFLKTVLSTVTSPLPLDIVITYRSRDVDFYVYGWEKPVRVDRPLPELIAKNTLHHSERFRVLSEMHRVREFRLVLCAGVPDCIAERALQALKQIVEAERMRGGLDYLLCEPLIICETVSPTRPGFCGCGLCRRTARLARFRQRAVTYVNS
jgi:hypothetical protein